MLYDLIGKEFEYGGRGPEKYDCWGLCVEVYKRLGINLPEFQSVVEYNLIHDKIQQGKELFEEIKEPEKYCLVTFTIRPPFVTHIGVVLDYPYFIHILKNTKVVVERLDSPEWQKRIKGFYKWKK